MLQKTTLELVDPMLDEIILSMNIMECKTFCIADLGCSCGPNSLLATQNMIKVLEAKYFSMGNPISQFQVFFNDIPTIDFNSLFRIFPLSLMTHKNDPAKSYFTVGVPGSFFGRLFVVSSGSSVRIRYPMESYDSWEDLKALVRIFCQSTTYVFVHAPTSFCLHI
jgi:hypothetical protein